MPQSGKQRSRMILTKLEKKSYLADRAPAPFSQTSKYGLRKKNVLHFLTTADMRTNQTLPALGIFRRDAIFCLHHVPFVGMGAATVDDLVKIHGALRGGDRGAG